MIVNRSAPQSTEVHFSQILECLLLKANSEMSHQARLTILLRIKPGIKPKTIHEAPARTSASGQEATRSTKLGLGRAPIEYGCPETSPLRVCRSSGRHTPAPRCRFENRSSADSASSRPAAERPDIVGIESKKMIWTRVSAQILLCHGERTGCTLTARWESNFTPPPSGRSGRR